MRRLVRRPLWVIIVTLVLLAMLASCSPAAAPTATPTKAPAATSSVATPPAAAPTVAKPADKPATTPTTGASTKPSGSPLKVGYLTPLSGPVALYGAMEKISVALAEEDLNKTGGINGRPVQVIRYDSPFDPKQAVTLVRKLATDDKVFAILGPFSSGEFDVAAPLANELQIPIVGMKTTKPGFSEQYRPWEFRVTVTDDLHTKAVIAAFKKQNPSVKSILIVGDTKESVSESMVKEVFPRFLKDAGYQIQDTVGYDSGTTDFSAIATKIKDMKPEAIAYSATPKGNPVGFAKELAALQVKVPVMVSVHFVPGPLVTQAGPAMEGWLATAFFDPTSTDPKAQDFVKRWQSIADADPTVVKPVKPFVEANSYDAAMILGEIMRKAGLTPETPLQEARAKIRDGLQALKGYKGITGEISMQPSGDATMPATVLIARGGNWEVFK